MNACVTAGPAPAKECMNGFRYSAEKSCCEAFGADIDYPPCKLGDYYSSEFGCMPLPMPDGGINSCNTLELIFAYCM